MTKFILFLILTLPDGTLIVDTSRFPNLTVCQAFRAMANEKPELVWTDGPSTLTDAWCSPVVNVSF